MINQARLEALRLAVAHSGSAARAAEVVSKAQSFVEFLDASNTTPAPKPEPLTFGELRADAAAVLEQMSVQCQWLEPDEVKALGLAIADLRAGA